VTSIGAAILIAYAVHLSITFPATWLITAVFAIRAEQHEAVSYFVAPFVLVFVSFPVGILIFHHIQRRGEGR
jgi:hypothetical protein